MHYGMPFSDESLPAGIISRSGHKTNLLMIPRSALSVRDGGPKNFLTGLLLLQLDKVPQLLNAPVQGVRRPCPAAGTKKILPLMAPEVLRFPT